MSVFFEFLGYLAGMCLAISFIPQAIQTYKSKAVEGISLLTYSLLNLGMICWVAYGFYLGSIQMIFFNLLTLCFSLPILLMIIRYQKKS